MPQLEYSIEMDSYNIKIIYHDILLEYIYTVLYYAFNIEIQTHCGLSTL